MNAPIAKTAVCAASNGHHRVMSTTASTTVVRMAEKRGPRGSTAGPADMSSPALATRMLILRSFDPAERVQRTLQGQYRGDSADANRLGPTQAAAHAAQINCAALRQQGDGQPIHEFETTHWSLRVGTALTSWDGSQIAGVQGCYERN